MCHCHSEAFVFCSIYSLGDNSIGDEGAVAISEAVKTMTNLQQLEYVDLTTIMLCQCHLLKLSCSYTVCPGFVFVIEYVTVMVEHFVFLCISIHSLQGNSIDEVGREAISAASELTGIYIP